MTTQAFIARNGLIVNTNILVVNVATGRIGVNTASPNVSLQVAANDAVALPIGNTGQRPTGAAGYIRYNSDSNTFEGFANGNWGAIGGGVTPGGANTNVQFNNSGALGGSANFVWNGTQIQTTGIQGLPNANIYFGAANSGDVNKPFIQGYSANNSMLLFGNTTSIAAAFDPSGFSIRNGRLQNFNPIGGTVSLDCANGNIIVYALNNNLTVSTAVNIPQSGFYTVAVFGNGFSVTWSNTVFWFPGGTPPVQSGGWDLYSFVSFYGVLMGTQIPNLNPA